tara:strand:+ start:1532 stop:2500 length:969 start_codon:yes stop_codon:yes gene_type:complete
MATITFTPSMLKGAGTRGVPEITAGSSYSYLLDDYGTGIGGAYSFRKLSSTYSGNCIRVRRSSDDAEADIGFDGNYLDETALLAHTGTGGSDDGFIVKWYEQSGAFTGYAAPNLNDGDLAQSTTSYQPRIVNNGVIVKGGGLVKAGDRARPVMKTPAPAGGVGNGWISNWGITLTEYTSFNVAYPVDANYYDSWLGSIASGATIRGAMGIDNTTNPRYLTLRSQAGSWSKIITGTTAITYDQFHVATGIYRTNPDTTSLALDGVAQGSITTFTPAVMNNLYWPGGQSGFGPDSSEWLLYKTPPNATDTAGIEANIMNYYGIS